MSLAPRIVVAHRASELEVLVDRHGTRGQVEFFLRSRGRGLAEVQARHDALQQALADAGSAIDPDHRRAFVERGDLHRFAFEPEDVVVAVGPDGLVANVAKYLDGQPVVGVDPEPGRNAGVLVHPRTEGLAQLLIDVVAGRVGMQERAMVRASVDDGEVLDALNDIYLGDIGHQSSRYRLQLMDGRSESQSSSGLVVASGTGATGWAASIARERVDVTVPLPHQESAELAWFVREAWPSPFSGTSLTAGGLSVGEELEVVVQSDSLVAFGDGMEVDRLRPGWGQTVRLAVSPKRLSLVS
ncbi:MAG: hypothetical protein LWW77_10310 [Propionibacteriales bacterium]|jgi:hypothetical protein|nr:hypothetical protein [Propionibacteriales bacterium]